MSFVGHDHVYNLVYASGLIRSTIYIIDQDQLRQFAGREFSLFYKVSVDEISGGTSVYHSFSRCFFQCVSGPKMCGDHETVRALFK